LPACFFVSSLGRSALGLGPLVFFFFVQLTGFRFFRAPSLLAGPVFSLGRSRPGDLASAFCMKDWSGRSGELSPGVAYRADLKATGGLEWGFLAAEEQSSDGDRAG